MGFRGGGGMYVSVFMVYLWGVEDISFTSGGRVLFLNEVRSVFGEVVYSNL